MILLRTRMAFLSIKYSKLVLALIILLKSILMYDAIETYSSKQHTTFVNVIKTLNDYHDFIDNEDNSDNGNRKTPSPHTNENKSYLNDIGLARRSDGSESAWICESEINWKDLGNLHYPRFVKEVLCPGRLCMHGYYRCIPQNYTVRVLSARQNEDVVEIALPRNLRDEWKLMDIQVSVGCVCGI